MVSKLFSTGDGYCFTVEIHRGGDFVYSPRKMYIGGSITLVENCDPAKFSLLDFNHDVKKFGYDGLIIYFYRIHGMDLDNVLRLVATDTNLVEMIAQMPPSRVIKVYLENVPVMDCWDNQVKSCDVSGSSEPREVISQIESDQIEELIADNVDVSVDKCR